VKHSDLPIGFHPIGRTTTMPRGLRMAPEVIVKRHRAPRPSKSDDPAYRKQAAAR
jgi:hypothetical protein